jgi:hypothetical protein
MIPIDIRFKESRYTVGNGLAITAMSQGRPYTTLSVNLKVIPELPQNVFHLKHWSENEELAEWLYEEGLIEKVGLPWRSSGYVREIAAVRLTSAGLRLILLLGDVDD